AQRIPTGVDIDDFQAGEADWRAACLAHGRSAVVDRGGRVGGVVQNIAGRGIATIDEDARGAAEPGEWMVAGDVERVVAIQAQQREAVNAWSIDRNLTVERYDPGGRDVERVAGLRAVVNQRVGASTRVVERQACPALRSQAEEAQRWSAGLSCRTQR